MSKPSVLPPKAGATGARHDRRIAVRYAGNPETDCHASVSPGGSHPAWVRDISASGVALLMARAVAPGTDLTLVLENASLGVTRLLRARVVHALEVPPNGYWLHGCSFERTLTDPELRAFAE